MFKIAGIDHIVLRTTKLSAMMNFYCEILGCSVERQTPEDIGLTQLRVGSSLIDLVVVDSQLGALGGGAPTLAENNLDHFCLQLQPISEVEIKQHLLSYGVSVDGFSKRYGAQGFGPSLYIEDPEGNTVELKSQV
ncbi:MAG: VOC family protein [Pseudomonadales bacterium]|nr:VOC family protein [Pseudomonadales bacterium]